MFTPFGFYSVVHNRECAPGVLAVRARYKADLDRLRDGFLPELGPTEEKPFRDYKFRAYAPQTAVAEAMKRFVESINYHNFKDEVMHTLGLPRELQCMRVWSVMNTPASEFAHQAKQYQQRDRYDQAAFSFSAPPKVRQARRRPVTSLFDPAPGDTGFEDEGFVEMQSVDPTGGSGLPLAPTSFRDDFDRLCQVNGFDRPGVASPQEPFRSGKNKRRGRKNRRRRNRKPQ
jgi:hypothetical protein